MRTYGSTTADVVVRDTDGLPAAGVHLTVWTKKNGTQITDLLDNDGNALPGYVITDDNGQYGYKIKSNSWPETWVRDPSGHWYRCVAAETISLAATAGAQFPTVQKQVQDMAGLFASLVTSLNIPDGIVAGDQKAADDNTSIINAAAQKGNVRLPEGKWWVNDSIRIPSGHALVGAGYKLTEIGLADGGGLNVPVVTNENNNLKPRLVPDTNIYISDLAIDGAWTTRNTGSQEDITANDINEAGSSLQLSCVEHCLVERVYGYHGHHNFHATGSMYSSSEYTPGPARWVTFRDCIGGWAFDDSFTTHQCEHIYFENCVAYTTEPMTKSNQNGFEVDDGSRDVVLTNCYSRGFNAGYQVKGHSTVPARRVTFVDCVADTCRMAWEIVAQDRTTSSAAIPTDYDFAADIQVIRPKVRNVSYEPINTGYLYSFLVAGYNNVRVEDLLVQDCPSAFINICNHANRVIFDGIEIENSWIERVPRGDTYDIGMISIGMVGNDTYIAGDDITIKNVKLRDSKMAAGAAIISVGHNTGKRLLIDGVHGAGSGTAAVALQAGQGEGWKITNIDQTGWTHDIYDAVLGQRVYFDSIVPNGALAASAPIDAWPIGTSSMSVSAGQASSGGWQGSGMVVTQSRGSMGVQFFYVNNKTSPLQTRTYAGGAWSPWSTINTTVVG